MKLKDWMKKAKMRSSDMAKFLHIERTYLHKITSGARRPSLEILTRINSLTMGQVKTFKELVGEENGSKKETTTPTTEKTDECMVGRLHPPECSNEDCYQG